VDFSKGVLETHSGLCVVSWSVVGSAVVAAVCNVQCSLAVGKGCKLDQVDHFSKILTECVGLDVPGCWANWYKNLLCPESLLLSFFTILVKSG